MERKFGPLAKEYKICEVETIDEIPMTMHAPRYQVEPVRSKHKVHDYHGKDYMADDCDVKIIGFGEFERGYVRGTSMKFHYQAPELIFLSQLARSADIWSLGCMVREVLRKMMLERMADVFGR